MTFYPVVTTGPGAFWGWDAAEGPCSDTALSPLFITPSSGGFPMRVMSFQDTAYGIAFDFIGASTLTPYEIDPTTLQIALGTPVSGPYSGFAADLQLAMVLDDSTMVVQRVVSTTAEYYVVTRSGLGLSISGPSAAVTIDGSNVSTARLDSTHVIRRYNPPSPNNLHTIVEVCSVSGGSVSVVHSDTIATTWNATIDPGGGTAAMNSHDFQPFHYDGSGTLYAYGQGSTIGGFGLAIYAVPFSIGGGIGTIGTSTRAKAASIVERRTNPPASKIGSSEVVLELTGGGKMPMWDDGTNMHYTYSGSATLMVASLINHNRDDADTATTQGDYLTGNVAELPAGSTVNSGPAIVSQSGEILGYTPITPRFLCPQFGTDIDPGAIGGVARHDSNLGMQIIEYPTSGTFLLRAFAW